MGEILQLIKGIKSSPVLRSKCKNPSPFTPCDKLPMFGFSTLSRCKLWVYVCANLLWSLLSSALLHHHVVCT
jgi:hypothetical protein